MPLLYDIASVDIRRLLICFFPSISSEIDKRGFVEVLVIELRMKFWTLK